MQVLKVSLSDITLVMVTALVVSVVGVYVFFSGVGFRRWGEERAAVSLAAARVKEDLVVYLNSSGGSLWVWVRARVGTPRITGYWYVFADGSVSRLHECNVLVTGPVPVAPWLSNASDFIVRTAIGNIYHLTYVPKNITVTESNETYLSAPVGSVSSLSGIGVPVSRFPVDTLWSVYFYGSSSTQVTAAHIVRSNASYFPGSIPLVVKYVSSKLINVTGTYFYVSGGVPVEVEVPLSSLSGVGVATGLFYVAVDNWVVKNVSLGRDGNATLTIKVGHKVGTSYVVDTYDLRAGDSIPNPSVDVNWVEVLVDGFLLKSWGSRYSTAYVSTYLHDLLEMYVLGQNQYGVGGYYRIGGFVRVYYAYVGSRFAYSGSSYVDVYGVGYAELSPTYWKVELVALGKWVDIGWGTYWRTQVLRVSNSTAYGVKVWEDLGLPIGNYSVTTGDYGLRANVTVLNPSGAVVAKYSLDLPACGSNSYGLPVFANVVSIPVTIDSAEEVVVIVYNETSGEVLWDGTQYVLPYTISVSGLSFTSSSVEYYLTGVDFSNYGEEGSGTLTVNGFTATLKDTGSSYGYVGRSYKVFSNESSALMYAPQVRIATHFVQTSSTTTTTSTTATNTTSSSPPWTPPPPATISVTFNVLTPALPADGKAHAIDVAVIGTPMPNDYANSPYFVASITEYTPDVGAGGSYEWRKYTVTALTLTPMAFFGDYVLGARFTGLGVVGGSTIPMGFNGKIVDTRYGTVTRFIGDFYNFKGTATYTTVINGVPKPIPITPKPVSVAPFAPIGIVGLLFFPLVVMVFALLRERLGLGDLLGRLLREYRVESVAYVASLVGLVLLFALT